MSKDNPDSKMDALCYQMEDILNVLRTCKKAEDTKGQANCILLIGTNLQLIREEFLNNS